VSPRPTERGSILVTAILLMTLMLGVAVSAYALVDQVEHAAFQERVSESSFNLSEGLLDVQVFVLSRRWPGTAANAYPSVCATGATDTHCPAGEDLAQRFGAPDVAAGVTWSTWVRDNQNPNPNFYDDTLTGAAPSYDANGDGRLWVRAQTTVRGRRRTLIGLVRVERVTEQMPQSAMVMGHFGTTNNGQKVIFDTQGTAAAPAPVNVRCLVALPGCLDYAFNKDQVKPDTTHLGYTGGNALSTEALGRMRDRAVANGTYYASGCPAKPEGAVVFVENGNCAYGNEIAPCCNSQTSPGVLIIARGTLSLTGNNSFYGVIYMANQQASSGYVITISGTALVQGSVQVDGNGGLMAGTSALNLRFDPQVFDAVVSYGNAGIIQNTWREIPS
jgi:hypothetical protein